MTRSIYLPDWWDAKQPKNCWENLKTRAKKVLAKEKRAAKLTGGGIPALPAASIIAAWIDSLENPFDDDICLVIPDCEVNSCDYVFHNAFFWDTVVLK
jgi:hypothetical protein